MKRESKEQVVRVGRKALLKAMREAWSERPRSTGVEVWLIVKDGLLTMTAGETSASVPVEGEGRFEASLDGLVLTRARKLLPKDDPIEVGWDGRSVRIGSFRFRSRTEPLVVKEASRPGSPPMMKLMYSAERVKRLERAVAVLAPYRVPASDLASLCREDPLGDPKQWQNLVSRIAAAWAELAVFGVKTEDIEFLVNRSVRNGWKW